MDVWISIFISICAASTPLLLAATGELVVERSGVLNLGVEGMMIIGAVAGFSAAQATGNPYAGAVVAVFAGAVFSLLFAFLTLTLVANQVATGLALTILGLGLSGMIGEHFVGQPGIRMEALVLGLDAIFYISIALIGAVSWFLFRTRAGLMLRSVGDSHTSAHALGLNVIRIRYLAVMFGGACAGLGGAHLSLVYVPQWVEGMTAGRGWIALALVVFASWRPARLLVGAYLFGAVTIAQFHAQAVGVAIPPQFLTSLPYLATIIVLVLIARNRRLTMINTPAALGQPFVPDR